MKLVKNLATAYRYLSSGTVAIFPSKLFGHASVEDLSYLAEKQNWNNTYQYTKWAVRTFGTWR